VAEQLRQRVDPHLLTGRALLAGGAAPGASPFAVGADLLAVIGALLARGPVVILLDDVQWADRPSIQALTFVLRRLSVEPLLALVVLRGDRQGLDEATTRLLASVDRRLNLRLGGLEMGDIATLAKAIGHRPLSADTARRLHEQTGGHALYLCTLLSEQSAIDDSRSGRVPVTPSLAAAVGEQLAQLSADCRALLEMLAVADRALPLARLGEVAGVASPAAAIEPALGAGLVDWQPGVPSCPVRLRHALQRDAIYALLGPAKRRRLHARAVSVVDATAAWAHRVAALEGPDDDLAGRLAQTAAAEAAAGHLLLAATHLLWAGDISSTRDGYEERLLTAVTYLLMADEARAISLRHAVEARREPPGRWGLGPWTGRQPVEPEPSSPLAPPRPTAPGRLSPSWTTSTPMPIGSGPWMSTPWRSGECFTWWRGSSTWPCATWGSAFGWSAMAPVSRSACGRTCFWPWPSTSAERGTGCS